MSTSDFESDFEELPALEEEQAAPDDEADVPVQPAALQISPGFTPSGVPPAIYRLKRTPDVFSGSGKRQKVFHSGGVTHFVDEDLMPKDDGEEDNAEGLSDEEEQRMKESQEHAFSLAKRVMIASITRSHTAGSRKIARTMRRQMETYDDVRWRINNDEEGCGWYPVPSPQIHRLHKFIGKHVDDADIECYGCTRGIGIERVEHEVIRELKNFITESFGRMELDELCTQTYEWFEDNIRGRFNIGLGKGENPIKPWSVPSIFEHITMHCNESTFLHWEMLRALHTHFRIIRDNSAYKAKVEALQSGRELSIADIHPSQAGHKMLLDSIKAITDLEAKDPRLMSNFNKNWAPASNCMGAVGTKVASVAARLTNKSIYDPIISGI